jgi:hypothetical protein
MIYSANEAEFIFLHTCSIQRGTKQSLHSEDANKLIDISRQETTVRNRFYRTILCVIWKPASFPARQKKPDYICFINVREMLVKVWACNMQAVLATPWHVMFTLWRDMLGTPSWRVNKLWYNLSSNMPLFCLHLLPWRWRQNVSLKCWCLPTSLHTVKTQKSNTVIVKSYLIFKFQEKNWAGSTTQIT